MAVSIQKHLMLKENYLAIEQGIKMSASKDYSNFVSLLHLAIPLCQFLVLLHWWCYNFI